MLNRHLLAYLPVYLAQALVGFGSVIVFTRMLSPDEYGRYMLVLAGASLLSTGLFTWLDAAIARFYARASARGRLPGHFFTGFRLLGLLCLGVGLPSGLALALIDMPSALRTACAFALAYTLLRAALMMALETRRAAGQAWRYSVLETFSLAGGFGFGVALSAFTGLGAAGPLAGLALAAGLAVVIDVPVLLRKASPDRADKARAAAFFAYGGPVAFSLTFELILTSGDRFLIAALMGEAATGAYSAGYAVADRSLSILFLWLGMTTGPLLISALEHNGYKAAQKVAHRTAALMAALGFPAAAGLALVAGPTAQLLIGEEISLQAASIIPLIALSGLMNGIMTHYFHSAYTLGRRTDAMAIIMTASAILNLLFNLALIPLLGLNGAALATVIAYAIALSVCAIHGRSVFALPIPTLEWVKAAAATAIMSLCVWALPVPGSILISLILQIVAGAFIYAVTMFALNSLGIRTWVLNTFRARMDNGLHT